MIEVVSINTILTYLELNTKKTLLLHTCLFEYFVICTILLVFPTNRYNYGYYFSIIPAYFILNI